MASWLDLLFRTGQAAPTRSGATFQGQAVPAGYNGVQALSADSTANALNRPEPLGHDMGTVRRANKTAKAANLILDSLFDEHAQLMPGQRPPSDKAADKLLDEVGFFDPSSGTLAQRQQRAAIEWARRYYGSGYR